MPNADTSKLDAVNHMLAVVGEDAVNSLDTNVSANLALAIRVLERSNKQVQTIGWHWNTDREKTITADSNSRYPWQLDWIRVDTDRFRYTGVDIVRRGQFLYNTARKKNTNVITRGTLKVDIVLYLDWVALPESARLAIMMKAMRIFAFSVLGDELRSGYSKLDEDEAMENLVSTDNDQADYTFEDIGAPAETRRDARGIFILPESA